MEAVEKDFQDLVTSEEEPTTAVTTDVEDEIIQQILTSEDDVEETVEVEETEDLEEEGILDDDEVEALSDEEGWEDVSEEDSEEMKELIDKINGPELSNIFIQFNLNLKNLVEAVVSDHKDRKKSYNKIKEIIIEKVKETKFIE